ncbi:hypothetical protein [Fimbriiglobus ruber]|uniref:Uncharacterized protein n=1 Tax=Fimbriiglobus ruber TaxID=1908690 RepID=A0A225D4K4_9BACT|nr:hypothetical protein [Fimbriiglobus ruber]OWK34574.1 hypothetical protein FRUB_10545 [Fimbriiglobus ruber]
MARLAWIGVAAVAAATAGCLDWNSDRTALKNKPVEVPQITDAAVAVSARVDQIGRQLLLQTPFVGIEPTFHAFGKPEPEIFHPDANGVFVSEGLISRCKSDAEVAAVLATELGKMAAERRIADRMKIPDPLNTVQGSGNISPGGISSDQTQLGVQAVFDRPLKPTGRINRPVPAEDVREIALELMKSAGFDAKALDAVAPLLQEAAKNHGVADQFGGRGAKPRWSN